MAWWSELVREHYPPAAIFDSERKITTSELRRFAGIILTEGIPSVFKEVPMAFEFGREKAAAELDIHPKQITLVGSGRIGYSLSPSNFGRLYDAEASDIDLFVVAPQLFEELTSEYGRFTEDRGKGLTKPRSDREEALWEDAATFCPSNISRGFFDAKFVPTWNAYPVSRRAAQANFLFKTNVNNVVGRSIVTRSGIRVYTAWEAAIEQITMSLRNALDRRLIR